MKVITGIAGRLTSHVVMGGSTHFLRLFHDVTAIVTIRCGDVTHLQIPATKLPCAPAGDEFLKLMIPIPFDTAVVTHPAWMQLDYEVTEVQS